eukprot:TRINITY_DN67579_c0_g1_i1.p1 TRINITY_DN67579_c0_g1~~TRINITY_DN67579_c0_g1_i1.p1  ORF type:complete len:632 (-),score=352.22 TRINITY_DN67579_c0_g1_i1:277-2172(-)
MLGSSSSSSRRARKGHAYSQWDRFRALPASTQFVAVALGLLVLYGVVDLLPSSHPQVDPSSSSPSSSNLAASSSSSSASAATALQSRVAQLQSEKKQLQAELDRAREEVRSLLSQQNNNNNKNKRVSMINNNDDDQTADDDDDDDSDGMDGPTGFLARRLGKFNYEKVEFEADSNARAFWIKTQTNEEGHHFYRRILISNGWLETRNPKNKDIQFLFYGRFVPNLDGHFSMFKEGKHVINHIPGEFAVLNKEPFLKIIRNNSIAEGCDYTEMHPEAYLVHEVEDCVELFRVGDNPRSRYVRRLETQEHRDNMWWFWKPPFNSFGRGIKISPLKNLREKFGFSQWTADTPNVEQLVRNRCQELAHNLTDSKSKLLVQRAVHNPFLIKGTKFDFRAYILIANAKPWVVYQKFGHVRRCLRKYAVDSKVKKAHVCNDYSDELEAKGFPLNDHIWGYPKFKEYLISLGLTGEEVDRAFRHNLKRVFLGVFKKFMANVPRKNGYWLMLGLDVAIDEYLNVKVLEANTNPSMHYGTRVWGQEIVRRNWNQMNEVLHLVNHYHHVFSKSKQPFDADRDLIESTKHGWELIYSDATSPPWQYVPEKCFKQEPNERVANLPPVKHNEWPGDWHDFVNADD